MKNKWYVGGMILPALVLLGFAANSAYNGGGLLALIPAALAIALIAAAFKVARADAFAPTRAERWDHGQTPEVQQWLHDRADRDLTDAQPDAPKK